MEEKIMFNFEQAIELWEEYLEENNIIFIKKEDIDNDKLTYLLTPKTNVKMRMEIDHQEISTEINTTFKNAQDKSPELLEEFADKINKMMQWDDRRFKYNGDHSFKYNQHNTLVDIDDLIGIHESAIGFIVYVSHIFIPGIEHIVNKKRAVKQLREFMEQ
jgi:hypothetical protein